MLGIGLGIGIGLKNNLISKVLGFTVKWVGGTTERVGSFPENPIDGHEGFVVSVKSNKWVIGKDGLLTEVLAGQPAYSYENGKAQLLVEEESSIVSKNSNVLDTFSNINTTVSEANIENPTGANDCWKIEVTQTPQPRIESTYGVPSVDTFYTLSVFVKKGNTHFVSLGRFSPNESVIFNLDTESVVSSSMLSQSIISIGNGWYRITATQLVKSTDTYNIWKLGLTNGVQYSTGVIGDYIYSFGLQIETSSNASSYVPMGSNIIQRLADEIKLNVPEYVTEIKEVVDGVESIITDIPTLYAMPNLGFGEELVVNGDFATDSDWDKGTGWSIGDNKAEHNLGTGGYLQQDIGLKVGGNYIITADVSNGNISIVDAFYDSIGNGELNSSNNTVYFSTKSQSKLFLYANNYSSIDNISVREVINGALIDEITIK